MNRRVRRALGVVAWAAAGVAIVLAFATAAFRIAVPLMPEYRADIEAWAGSVFGAPVDIDGVDLRWRGLRPEFVLDGVRYVSADATRAFAAAEVRVALSIAALARGRLAPARVALTRPDLTLVLDPAVEGAASEDWRRMFAERDRHGEVVITDGRLILLADQGRRRYAFDAVDARIASDGHEHRFELDTRASVAGTVSVRVRANGWPERDGFDAELVAAMVGADVRALQLLAGEPSVSAGTVDGELVLRFDRHGLYEGSADVAFHRLAWDGGRRRSGGAALRWVRRAGGWDATVATPGHGAAAPLAVAYTASTAPDAPEYWRLSGSVPRLGDLMPLGQAAAPWLPAQSAAWLRREPRGRLDMLDLAVRRVPGEAAEWTLQAVADRLALAADAASPVPGFGGVDATIAAESTRGRAEIELRRAHAHWPGAFRGPMRVSSGELVVDWHRAGDGWVIVLPTVDVVGPDARADGVARIVTRRDAPPLLDLDFAFDDVLLAAHAPYLPVRVMPESVVAWLDRAVVGGRGERGVFRYDGPAGGAALQAGDATLDVRFQASGVELAFADGWPALKDGVAAVAFDGHGFRAEVASGTLAGAPVAATVALPEYHAPTLSIAGVSDAMLDRQLDAFRATPVGSAAWLRDARAGGTASLALDVSVPLQADARLEVEGRLALADASLTLTGFRHPVTGIDGVLMIHEDGATADAITGELLGRPVEVGVETLRDGDGIATGVQVAFDGSLDAATLAVIAERELPQVAGSARWRGELRAPYDGVGASLRLRSDLVGMAIDLPEPLGKMATKPRSLTMDIALADAARRFTATTDDGFEAVGDFERRDGGWALARARVHFGGGPALAMPDSGIAIGGRLARWRHGADDGVPDGAIAGADASLVAVDVEVGELELYGRALGRVRVDGERAPGGWFWVLHGESLSGSVDLPVAPTNERPIRIELEHAVLPEVGDAVDAVTARVSATSVPPIAFYAGALRVGGRDFGEVSGLLRRVENGIALEGFTAARAEARLVADGTWHTVDGYHRTTLRGTLDSTDVRATLGALGYAASMEAAAGHVEADLHWMDSIVGDPLPSLGGSVAVRVERGVLLDVDAGAGRVFGLLSLSALPRRLALDFSDVFRRGLAFDTIAGRFAITDGDAFSDDLELVGPAVRIAVHGRTGLASRDYDQRAEVTASLASSLTLAGALAGGPAVGAAMLIASEVFRGQLDDIARVRYRVSGPWDAPQVERLTEPR